MKSTKILLAGLLFIIVFSRSYSCTVTSFSPFTNVCVGDQDTINGIFASSGSTTPLVVWNGTSCSIQSYSASKIFIKVP